MSRHYQSQIARKARRRFGALCALMFGSCLLPSLVQAEEMSREQFDAIVQERVIGGKDAEINDWPSAVAIVSAPDGVHSLFDRQFCGGTVVSSRLVLTAAHCVVSSEGVVASPDFIRIVGGTSSLREDQSVEERIVSNIYPHPSYQISDSSVTDDIALIELANDIDLPPANLFTGNPEDYEGKMTSIVGWGAVSAEDDNLMFTYDLQEAEVPIVARGICNQPRSYDGTISDSQLCAGYQEGGIDTCSGDSGGPLYLDVEGQFVLAGVTSYGNGCAQANYYGVYTSVASYVPWINDYAGGTTWASGSSTEDQSSGEREQAYESLAAAEHGNTGHVIDDTAMRSGGAAGAALSPGVALFMLFYCLLGIARRFSRQASPPVRGTARQRLWLRAGGG